MFKFGILASMVVAQSAAVPAWEVSDRWICKAEQARYCRLDKSTCSLEPGQAVVQIDFNRGTFKPLGTDAEFEETITGRKVYSSTYESGSVELYLSSGDVLAIALKPRGEIGDGKDGRAYVTTRMGLHSQNIYYGICYPL